MTIPNSTQQTGLAATGRVLLVDDDEPIRTVYARLLRSLGCVVHVAVDGSEGIEMLQRESFDLVISDIRMPKMPGTALLRAVREWDLDVPVILMTGAPDLETAVEAVEYGALRYLSKPVGLDTFAQVVPRAIHMHQLARLKREALEIVGAEGRQLGDRASLEVRFTVALEKLWMAYQPIVQWPARVVYAYEALVRSEEPSLKSPPDLLDAAERLGRLHDLGRRIRFLVASSAADAPEGSLLFVNLHSADLNDSELFATDSPLAAFASKVVLEITERASLSGVDNLSDKIAQLRRLGYRIAVDDLGAGYAGLSTFSQLEPDYAKLDMSLIRGIDTSERKRSVVRAMTGLCEKDLRIQVICEGVETAEERDILEQDGAVLLQGYLFGKPDKPFVKARW